MSFFSSYTNYLTNKDNFIFKQKEKAYDISVQMNYKTSVSIEFVNKYSSVIQFDTVCETLILKTKQTKIFERGSIKIF